MCPRLSSLNIEESTFKLTMHCKRTNVTLFWEDNRRILYRLKLRGITGNLHCETWSCQRTVQLLWDLRVFQARRLLRLFSNFYSNATCTYALRRCVRGGKQCRKLKFSISWKHHSEMMSTYSLTLDSVSWSFMDRALRRSSNKSGRPQSPQWNMVKWNLFEVYCRLSKAARDANP